MNDLLWLANHPLRGNVVGILTRQNPDTPEGLESRLSVRIHRILVELPHSTELELKKLRWTQTDSIWDSMLELLWGLQQAEKSSGHQNPASLSTQPWMNLGAL
jgi:hypothetical protein